MVGITLLSSVCLGLAATVSAAAPSLGADGKTYVSALGIGTVDKAKSTKFYTTVFGFTKIMSVPVPGMAEDIMANGQGGSALVTMSAGKKNVKNQPIKLQFWCTDPAKAQAAVVTAGGTIENLKTESQPTALYARDLDGYLLEIILPDNSKLKKPLRGCLMSQIGIGTSDLEKSVAFWAKSLDLPAPTIEKYAEWSSATFKPTTNSQFSVISFNETPKRPTSSMVYKTVLASTNTKSLVSALKAAGARPAWTGFVGFGKDAIDKGMIEINKGM